MSVGVPRSVRLDASPRPVRAVSRRGRWRASDARGPARAVAATAIAATFHVAGGVLAEVAAVFLSFCRVTATHRVCTLHRVLLRSRPRRDSPRARPQTGAGYASLTT